MTSPFQIRVDDGQLDDLRERLRRTRWPEPATAPGEVRACFRSFMRRAGG